MDPESRQSNEDSPQDAHAIRSVISKVKSQGLFDQFRKECLTDVDTKPAYNNLIQRVEKFVERFLNGQKWTSNVSKNQLRETLRRQLNNSGVMSIGVDRIIEQVVNPKIMLGIKPKIDEAVCDYLGIDQKARQEEQQKRKQEQQRLALQQHQLQQQHLQNMINQNMKSEDAFNNGAAILPTPGSLPWSQSLPGSNFPGNPLSGMSNSVPGTSSASSSLSGPFNPQSMGFGGMMQSFYMGGWAPGLPGMEGFNQTMQSMVPGQPMIPGYGGSGIPPPVSSMPSFSNTASPSTGNVNSSFSTSSSQSTSAPTIPDLSKPPPILPGTPLLNPASSIGSSPHQSSPLAPPGIMPSPVSSIIRPPPPGSVPPPPGTVPVLPPVSLVPLPPHRTVPTTPTIPALISHTLSKVSQEDLTPEKIAVFKTAAAFITKTVNNAQGTLGADLATMFSPRVLAEAMMAESGKPLTKQQIRSEKRKERQKEFERLKAERARDEEEERRRVSEMKSDSREDPLPPNHNLMDVFQAAEDVSEDEEAFDMLIDAEELENRHRQGIVLSDDSKEEEQPPTSQPGKKYNFAWDVDKDPGQLSDVTVSSIHTSDISSYEDLSSNDSEEEVEAKEDGVLEKENADSSKAEQLSEVDDTNEQMATRVDDDDDQVLEPEKPPEKEDTADTNSSVAPEPSSEALQAELPKPTDATESQFAANIVPLIPPIVSAVALKPSKPEVTKPRKLISLSYKYSDSDDDESREERKARIAKEKEDRYMKRQQRRAEMESKRKEREEERTRLKMEKKKLKELQKQLEQPEEEKAEPVSETNLSNVEVSGVEDLNASIDSTEPGTPSKLTPKRRKNKAEMKEQLHQKKVLERKAALCRQRTRNHRYASGEFSSIFSERKSLNQSYTEPTVESEEILTFDGGLEVVEMTVDQECVVETVGVELDVGDVAGRDDLVLQCRSPYSDISDRSMSDSSEEEPKVAVEMEEVSSDEDLETVDRQSDDEAVKTMPSSVHESDDSLSQNKKMSFLEGITPSPRLTAHSKSDASLGGGNSVTEDEERGKSPQGAESSDQALPCSTDDLFKHNIISLRTTSTPPLSFSDAKSSRANPFSLSDNEDRTSQLSGVVSSLPSQPDGVDKLGKEASEDSAAEEGEMASPKEAVDIMGELELESVSDEDSPLDNLNSDSSSDDDKEEGEERDSDKEEKFQPIVKAEPIVKVEAAALKASDKASKDDEASDEGEIKSDSEESELAKEEEKERMAHRKPIELVDFGEAEKRARGTRSYYPETTQERGRSARGVTVSSHPPPPPLPPPYRGGYTPWPPAETSIHSQYSASAIRYSVSHDVISSTNVKSPMGASYDGGESEASSHSRSSARLRDDVPPPYPIEGVTRKHRSPASDQGPSTLYKTLSPPSPVSSVSSHTSSSVHSKSGSGSQSKSGSRSGSSSSSSSRSSHRRKTRSERNKRRLRRSKDTDKPASVLSQASTSKLLAQEQHFSPVKFAEEPTSIPLINQPRERHLSSGHESISSDELPYFPDEQPPSPVKKTRSRSPGENSSSSSASSVSHKSVKKVKGKRKESISSSELIYSPSRQKSPRHLSESSKDDDEVSIERPPMSPGRSSISSDELPEDPEPELLQQFSPHQPPLPTDLPPLPEDTDGFQPPLPQDSPPMFLDTYLPPPPLEEDNENSTSAPFPPREVEDGEIEDEIEDEIEPVQEKTAQEKVQQRGVKNRSVVESIKLSLDKRIISPQAKNLAPFDSQFTQTRRAHDSYNPRQSSSSSLQHCTMKALHLTPSKSHTSSPVNVQSVPAISSPHPQSPMDTLTTSENVRENASLQQSEAYLCTTSTDPVVPQTGDITLSINNTLDEIGNVPLGAYSDFNLKSISANKSQTLVVTNSAFQPTNESEEHEKSSSGKENSSSTKLSHNIDDLMDMDEQQSYSSLIENNNKTSHVPHLQSEIPALPSDSDIKAQDENIFNVPPSGVKSPASQVIQSSSEMTKENTNLTANQSSSELDNKISETPLSQFSADETNENTETFGSLAVPEKTIENVETFIPRPSSEAAIEIDETCILESSSEKAVESAETFIPRPSSEAAIEIDEILESSSEKVVGSAETILPESSSEKVVGSAETILPESSLEKVVGSAETILPESSSEKVVGSAETVLPESSSEKVVGSAETILPESNSEKVVGSAETILPESSSEKAVGSAKTILPESSSEKVVGSAETILPESISEKAVESAETILPESNSEKVVGSAETILPESSSEKAVGSAETILPKSSSEKVVRSAETILPESSSEKAVESVETILPESSSEKAVESVETILPESSSEEAIEIDETFLPEPCLEEPLQNKVNFLPKPNSMNAVEKVAANLHQSSSENAETAVPLPSSEIKIQSKETVLPQSSSEMTTDLAVSQSCLEVNIEKTETVVALSKSEKIIENSEQGLSSSESAVKNEEVIVIMLNSEKTDDAETVVPMSSSEKLLENIDTDVPMLSSEKITDSEEIVVPSSEKMLENTDTDVPMLSSEKTTDTAETAAPMSSSEKTDDAETVVPMSSSEKLLENIDTDVPMLSSEKITDSAEIVVPSSEKMLENTDTDVPMLSSEKTTDNAETAAPMSSSEKTTDNAETTALLSSSEKTTDNAETAAPLSSSEKTTDNAETAAPMSSSEKTENYESVAPLSNSEKATKNSDIFSDNEAVLSQSSSEMNKSDAKPDVPHTGSNMKPLYPEAAIVLESCPDITAVGPNRTLPNSLPATEFSNTSETDKKDSLSIETMSTEKLLSSTDNTNNILAVTQQSAEIPTIDCYKSLPNEETQHTLELLPDSTTVGTPHVSHSSLDPLSSLDALPLTPEPPRLPKEDSSQDIKNPTSPELPSLAEEGISQLKTSCAQLNDTAESYSLGPPSLTRQGDKSPIPLLELSPQTQTITGDDEPPVLNLQLSESHQQSSESQQRPSESHHQSSESQQQLSESHHQSSESQQQLSESHQHSTKSQQQSSESHHQSSESQQQLSESHQQSSESHQQSSESHQQSSDSQQQSADSHQQSSESHQHPTESQHQLSESHQQSSESQQQSSESHQQSSENQQQQSSESHQQSSENQQQQSSESHQQSTESHQHPTESHEQPFLHTLSSGSNKTSSHLGICAAQETSTFSESNVKSVDSSIVAENWLTPKLSCPSLSSELALEQTLKNIEIRTSQSGSTIENVSSLETRPRSPAINSPKEVLPCKVNMPTLICENILTTATLTEQNTAIPKYQQPAALSPNLSDTFITSQSESAKSSSPAPKLELPKESISSPQTLPSPGQRSISSEDTCETPSAGVSTRKRGVEDSGNSSDASAASSSESVPKRRRRNNIAESLILPSSSAATPRPETRLQQQQQQELSKPQTRGRSNSLPSSKEAKRKAVLDKTPPAKKQKR